MMYCFRSPKGVPCSRHATHHVAFRAWGGGESLRLGGANMKNAVIDGWIPIPLCGQCARSVNPWSMMTAEWWEALTARVVAAGHPPPTLKSVLFFAVEGVPEIPLDTPKRTTPEIKC